MPTERIKIERLRVAGFKSIREADLALRPLNVVIGANGAGKSNLVSYFSFLKACLENRLDGHVGQFGGPCAFLHLGSKVTREIQSAVTVTTEQARATLYQRLEFQAPNSIVSSHDHLGKSKNVQNLETLNLPGVCVLVEGNGPLSNWLQIGRQLGAGIGVHHFHDTTQTASIRSTGPIDDNRVLHSDAGNLAAFLFRLQYTRPKVYQRIRASIRLVAPFFDDFCLAPRPLDATRIVLDWRQVGFEDELGPHQLSGGTLRAMGLIALLQQPEEELPKLIVIDEPEVALHPYALSVIVSLLGKASQYSQILVATQSVQLLDECEPEDVICVDRRGPESIFKRLDSGTLKDWLKEYSLGEAWQKNIIGGSPL